MTRRFQIATAIGVTCLGVAAAWAQVPAVMYHAHENLGYVRQNFEAHMDFFVENEFTTITMDQLYEWHQHDGLLPYRPVAITVDDNYIIGYTDMYPIFAERGMVATNYAHTLGIGIGAPKAVWSEVREMDEAGVFLVESHSRTHPRLSSITPSQLEDEVWGSRQDIADNVNGKVTNHFCYPYGNYNEDVIEELIAAGYRTGMTTISGRNFRDTPIYELRRWGGDGRTLQQFLQQTGLNNLPAPPPGEGWILDDGDPNAYYDPEEWNDTANAQTYEGRHRLREPGGPAASPFRWAAYLPEGGLMRVHARWSAGADRASAAVYTIRTAGQDRTMIVDQRANGGQWVPLGDYRFPGDGHVEVLLGGASDGMLSADAIWFEPLEEPNVDAWLVF